MYDKRKHYIMLMIIKSARSSGVRCMICIKNNDASWMAQMELSKFSCFASFSTLWYEISSKILV